MKKESNEVRYKLAELLLKRMQESGLISGNMELVEKES